MIDEIDEIDETDEDEGKSYKVSLEDFNKRIMKDILDKMMGPVVRIMKKNNLKPDDISQVRLEGGSTRIKCV